MNNNTLDINAKKLLRKYINTLNTKIDNVSIQAIQGIQTGTGTQGPAGIQGNVGVQGLIGEGTQGVIGIQGLTGIGIQGLNGIQGLVGTGIQGNSGTQGLQGVIGSGIQGLTGIQGYNGSLGLQGSTGAGIQGTTGIQGITGTGIQGSTGSQGLTGSGSQGTTGTQGVQGITGGGAGGITLLKTTANQTINGGAGTFVNITDLTFTVVNGVSYAFYFYITFQSSATTTGWRAGVNCPTGALDFWATSDIIANGAAGVATHTERHNTVRDDMTLLTATITQAVDLSIEIRGRYLCTQNGTFACRFANELAANTNIVVQKGSWGWWF